IRATNDEKYMVEGSKRALTIPVGWLERASAQGVLILPEGASDVAAAWTMGLAAVGRPGANLDPDILRELLSKVPGSVEVVLVGERDQKKDGKWPSVDGIRKLVPRIDRAVKVVLPPDGAKDVRAWLNSQKPNPEDAEACRALGKRSMSEW